MCIRDRGEAGHDAQHAAEAVEERHRQAHTVLGAEFLALADVEAVVQDVAVREHDALGEARSAARVLHHDYIVVVELALGPFQRAVGLVLAEQQKLGHAVEAAVLLLSLIHIFIAVAELGQHVYRVAALSGHGAPNATGVVLELREDAKSMEGLPVGRLPIGPGVAQAQMLLLDQILHVVDDLGGNAMGGKVLDVYKRQS